ncbi:cation transport protein ChaC [Limibacillus sp. MBR-115]|jgi:cation transport protein ChaC
MSKIMTETASQRIATLERRLAQEGLKRPAMDIPRDDYWVFGYGSLMWDPGFPHLEVRATRLHGFRRCFCVYSYNYRGTPERPGLVLGLDRGGSCWGLAYRVPRAEGAEVMAYLYEREMMTGVYIPRWLALKDDRGRSVTALGFVVDRHHKQYAGALSDSETAALICQGAGKRGACQEYLRNTVRHLEALGMHDRSLHRLLQLVETT